MQGPFAFLLSLPIFAGVTALRFGLIFAGGHRAVVHLVIQQDFLLGQHKIALPGGVQRRVAVCIGPGQIYMVSAAFQFYQVPGVGGVLGHAADLCAPQICLAAKVFKSAGIALTNGRPALNGAVGGGNRFAADGVVVISSAQGDHRCQVAVRQYRRRTGRKALS